MIKILAVAFMSENDLRVTLKMEMALCEYEGAMRRYVSARPIKYGMITCALGL